MNIKKAILIMFLVQAFGLSAQEKYTQTLRGKVIDKTIQITVPSAIITIAQDTNLKAKSDGKGNFRFDSLPVGNYTLICNAKYYSSSSLEVLLTSAKEEEVIFSLSLAGVSELKKVSVKGVQYYKPIVNDMAPISSHSFSVQETQNFAAAINDPARMVTSFAGVVGADDGSNQISIRGNNPSGLLWRVEGIDIPAPNHFSSFDGASGGISLVSSQLLTQSDFFTGAFSPEYGNALGGVFDLKMRKGNDQKHEHTFQAGILGIDIATEGPLSKKGGSYLINYRYSTLDLLSKIGFDLFGGLLSFQDLSFNVAFPKTKLGDFTVFGMGGLSSQYEAPKRDSSQWEFEWDRYHYEFISNTGILGATHSKVLGKKTIWKNVAAISGNKISSLEKFIDNNYDDIDEEVAIVENKKMSFTSTLTKQFNKHHSLRTGVYLHALNYESRFEETDIETLIKSEYGNTSGSTSYAQSFAQWKYRPTRKLTFVSGLHYMILGLNKKQTVEPRLAVLYKPKVNQSVSLGLGMHSQMQLPAVYFTNSGANSTHSNKDLDFTKAAHAVLGYEYWFGKKLRAKIETYYQHLYNVPVGLDANSKFSLLNLDWGINPEDLINKGKGRNKGVELTLERLLQKRMYAMLTMSMYKSEFQTQTNEWYETRFNGSHAVTSTFGKEFLLKSNKNLLGLNMKTSWYGGLRTPLIDLEQSRAQGETVRDLTVPYGNKLPNYLRIDLKLSYRVNHKRFNSWWSLDLQNAINRKNVGGQYFDSEKNKIEEWYMTSLLPVLAYKIEF